MSSDDNTMGGTERDSRVWWCEYCTEQVGTDGEEPDECPTCGHSDWKRLAETER